MAFGSSSFSWHQAKWSVRCGRAGYIVRLCKRVVRCGLAGYIVCLCNRVWNEKSFLRTFRTKTLALEGARSLPLGGQKFPAVHHDNCHQCPRRSKQFFLSQLTTTILHQQLHRPEMPFESPQVALEGYFLPLQVLPSSSSTKSRRRPRTGEQTSLSITTLPSHHQGGRRTHSGGDGATSGARATGSLEAPKVRSAPRSQAAARTSELEGLHPEPSLPPVQASSGAGDRRTPPGHIRLPPAVGHGCQDQAGDIVPLSQFAQQIVWRLCDMRSSSTRSPPGGPEAPSQSESWGIRGVIIRVQFAPRQLAIQFLRGSRVQAVRSGSRTFGG